MSCFVNGNTANRYASISVRHRSCSILYLIVFKISSPSKSIRNVKSGSKSQYGVIGTFLRDFFTFSIEIIWSLTGALTLTLKFARY